MVTSGEREAGRGRRGVGGRKKNGVIMGLYEIICVKLLKIVKHYRTLKNLSFSKKRENIPSFLIY